MRWGIQDNNRNCGLVHKVPRLLPLLSITPVSVLMAPATHTRIINPAPISSSLVSYCPMMQLLIQSLFSLVERQRRQRRCMSVVTGQRGNGLPTIGPVAFLSPSLLSDDLGHHPPSATETRTYASKRSSIRTPIVHFDASK
jgi:hypothetical protein